MVGILRGTGPSTGFWRYEALENDDDMPSMWSTSRSPGVRSMYEVLCNSTRRGSLRGFSLVELFKTDKEVRGTETQQRKRETEIRVACVSRSCIRDRVRRVVQRDAQGTEYGYSIRNVLIMKWVT